MSQSPTGTVEQGHASSFAAVSRADRAATPPPTMRVLIVDDHRDAAMSLSLLMRMAGHEVRMAHDGREAVAAAQAFRPHLALLDIGLPVMDGYEAASAIRGQDWGRDMILIAVTGWDNEEDRQRSVEAGFDHHLVKPVDLATLCRVMATIRKS
jgi:CheY-like chemotaxis protein